MSMKFLYPLETPYYVHDSFISKSRNPGTLVGRDKQAVAPTGLIMIIG